MTAPAHPGAAERLDQKMNGFCGKCGSPLDAEGRCPQCAPFVPDESEVPGAAAAAAGETKKSHWVVLACVFLVLVVAGSVLTVHLKRKQMEKNAATGTTVTDTAGSGEETGLPADIGVTESEPAADTADPSAAATAVAGTAAPVPGTTTAAQNTTAPAASGTPTTAPAGATPAAPATSPASSGQTSADTTPVPTTAPAERTTIPTVTVNEYDILRSDHCYMKMRIVDYTGTSNLEFAMADGAMYMRTCVDDMDLAVLMKDKKTYMLYPKESVYLKLSSVMMSMLGEDIEELFNPDQFGFSTMGPLSGATVVAEVNFNGETCTAYTVVNSSDNTISRVYMKGDKLMGFDNLDANYAVTSTTYVDYITEDIPADKIDIPSSYKKVDMLKFMSYFTDITE